MWLNHDNHGAYESKDMWPPKIETREAHKWARPKYRLFWGAGYGPQFGGGEAWGGYVLPATTACTLSTSQLPQVLRAWCAFYILTSTCASGHKACTFSTVQLPKVVWDLQLLNVSHRSVLRATTRCIFFISHLATWLRTRRISVFCHVFFWLYLFFWSFCFFSSHLFFVSAHNVGSFTSRLSSFDEVLAWRKVEIGKRKIIFQLMQNDLGWGKVYPFTLCLYMVLPANMYSNNLIYIHM